MANTIIRVGTVETIEGKTLNETDGLRIKVRLPQDGDCAINDVPWAFPLLPKMFQTAPKQGEAVLIITAEAENTKSQRFYIGPIVSQPQFMEECQYQYGDGIAASLLQGSSKYPIGKISNNASTTGAFPTVDDVALIGRGKEDIRLKYDPTSETSETDITAGVRQKPHETDNPDIHGNVVFNSTNPTYIQVKHGKKLSQDGESFVNIVGEKINIMSHNDKDVKEYLKDNQHLVNEESYDKMMNKLHPAVKGDKLVELLELMIGAIKNHVHPWNGMEQCGDWKGYLGQLNMFDVNSIISQDIKIS